MEFRDTVRSSVIELDRTLGERVCGMAVSGTAVPKFTQRWTQEDPMHITERVLVEPMLALLGYTRAGDGRVAIVTATMNSALSSVSEETITNMLINRYRAGIGTDGFRWILIARNGEGRTRVSAVFDLREYYLEELERIRFRAAVERDPEVAEEFVRRMSRGNVVDQGRS